LDPDAGWKNSEPGMEKPPDRDPRWKNFGSGFWDGKKTGSGINIPGQISDGTVGNNFWVKNIKIFVNSLLRIWIRNPEPFC
jgi:hypothetical protein